MSDEGPKEVQIKDLLEPFTVDEYLMLIFPSRLQGFFVRPVCKIMLEEKKHVVPAIQTYHQQIKTKIDEEVLGETEASKFRYSFLKFGGISLSILMMLSLFIYASTWMIHYLAQNNLLQSSLTSELVIMFLLGSFFVLSWAAFKLSQSVRIFFAWSLGMFKRFLISIYEHREKWAITFLSIFFVGTYFWFEEQSSHVVSDFVLCVVVDHLSPDGYELNAIPSQVNSIVNAMIFFIQLFLATALLVPQFTNFLLSAVKIPYQRPVLRARFAEKNLDLIIHPKRPYDMQNTLLEDYPDYGDQERNPDQMIEFQNDLTRAKDDGVAFGNTQLHTLFTPKAHEALCPKLQHYEWCIVGLWAFSDIKPNDGADWSPKPKYKEFAQVQFCLAFYNYISHNEVGSKTRRDTFSKDYGKDGSFDPGKSEELCESLLGNKNSSGRKLLEEVLKEVVT